MRVGKFTEKDWEYLLDQFSKVHGPVSAEQFRKSDLAKFVASAPYVCGGRDPDRNALAYMLMLKADLLCQMWDYRLSDNSTLFRRIETLNNYGSRSSRYLMAYFLRALTITAIGGYTASQEDDKKKGILNPITDGVIDGPKVVTKLTKKNKKGYTIWKKAAPFVDPQPVDWP